MPSLEHWNPRAPWRFDREERRTASALMALALPIMGITVSRMAMTFIDVAMVAWLGVQELAAILPAAAFCYAIFSVGSGLVSSVQTFAAQADGRGEPKEGAGYAWNAIYIALAMGALSWPLCEYVPPLFRAGGEWIGHEPGVLAAEIAYVEITLLALAPAILTSALESFFNGIGRPRVCILANVASVVANALANYAFIFGHWGFEPMGIRGAALGTVVGWIVRALVLAVAFVSPIFGESHGTLAAWRFSLPKMRGIAKLGLPLAAMWFLDVFAWNAFLLIVVPRYGEAAMAAVGVAIQYLHLGFMPALGVGFALRTLVGNAVGEGRPDKGEVSTAVAARLTMLYMGAVGLLMMTAGEPLVRWFASDPKVVYLGVLVLLWCGVFQWFDAFAIVYSNALIGAGETRWPAAALIVCSWTIFVGGGLAMSEWAPGLGIHGPWMMCTINIVTLGIVMRARFRGGAWKKVRIFDERSGPAEPVAVAVPVAEGG